MQQLDMTYRTLGRTRIKVSVVSLGTGGDSRLGQATHKDRRESERVVRRALDLGINLIDTAPTYVDAEEIVGDALQDMPRAEYLIATKATIVSRGALAAPEEIVATFEQSLRRLRTDYIDGMMFHNVGPDDYDAVVEQLYPTALRLKEQGKVRFLGLTERQDGRGQSAGSLPNRAAGSPSGPRQSNRMRPGGDPAHDMAARALQDDLWDVLGIKYGILNQVAEREILPTAAARGVGVLNMSAVRVKLVQPDQLEALIADWKTRGLVEADALPEHDPLGFLVHGEVSSVIVAGYKFAIAPEAVSSVVVGTGNAHHLEENIATILGTPLPAKDSARLRQLFGHIIEGV